MKHETMKILFVIKKSSLLKNGEAPIVVRVTINGVSDEVRIQRSVLPRLWNQARGCCKGRDRVSIELNDYIESLKTKIHNLHKELLLEDALITPSHLEKPNKFDPFGQKESAHLIYHTIAPLKVLVMGVNFILPF